MHPHSPREGDTSGSDVLSGSDLPSPKVHDVSPGATSNVPDPPLDPASSSRPSPQGSSPNKSAVKSAAMLPPVPDPQAGTLSLLSSKEEARARELELEALVHKLQDRNARLRDMVQAARQRRFEKEKEIRQLEARLSGQSRAAVLWGGAGEDQRRRLLLEAVQGPQRQGVARVGERRSHSRSRGERPPPNNDGVWPCGAPPAALGLESV